MEIPRMDEEEEEAFEGWGEGAPGRMSMREMIRVVWGLKRQVAELEDFRKRAEEGKIKQSGEDAVDKLVEANKETWNETDKIIKELREENRKLKEKMEKSESNTRIVATEVEGIKTVWKKQTEDNTAKLSEIIKEQKKVQEENKEKEKKFTQNVVRVIKEKENVVRDTIDKKKIIVIFGIEEEEIRDYEERKKSEVCKAGSLFSEIDDIGRNWEEEVEEIHRVGRYEKGKSRPLKVKFKVKAVAEEVMSKTWKLGKSENLKKYGIRNELTREEREIVKAKVDEVKQRNEERTEEDKKNFFWKVVGGKEIRKWYYRGARPRQNIQAETTQQTEAEGSQSGGENREETVGRAEEETEAVSQGEENRGETGESQE